jgi:hypothetical protein
MAYTDAEARQQLLDTLAQAADDIGYALACLGAAYEQLDEYSADKLEEQLFRPVQMAYGRAKRTHAEFAARHGLGGQPFESQAPGLPSTGARGFIDNAVEAVGAAGGVLATLQDSALPVEVGDVELRAGLAEVRELIADLPQRARELVRGLGR